MLSIGAAYGVVVAVFQWGWGRSFEDSPSEPIIVAADDAVVIPPARLHHVELGGPARFAVEFYRLEPAESDHGDGLESTGLA